jgi:hypothetical protein
MQLPPSTVRKNALLAPFYTINDHFTKIGSGQTQEKLRAKGFFCMQAAKSVDPAVSNPMWAGRPDIRAAQAISPAHPQVNSTPPEAPPVDLPRPALDNSSG